MKIVILSGGSGARLWPLSNLSRSKQFLQLLDGANGQKESMAYRMYHRLKHTHPKAEISFLTSEIQKQEVKKQLGDVVRVVAEPSARCTFPAVILACADFISNQQVDENEIIIVVPVDISSDQDYFDKMAEMEQIISRDEAMVALMATVPTYPSAKYSYITKNKDSNRVNRIMTQVSEKMAKDLIEKEAFWNTGVYAFKINTFFQLLENIKFTFNISNYEEVVENYHLLEAVNLAQIMARESAKISCVIHQGNWKDIGTWNTLTEEIDSNTSGIVTMGEECKNTHVINELSIPLVVLGTEDLIVATSPDGILVSNKHKSSYLAPYVTNEIARPMFEERHWGEYKVLDYEKFADGEHSLTKRLTVETGQKISYQSHTMRDEIWTIVDGEGELLIEGKIKHVTRGDVAYIKKGVKHALKALHTIQLIEVQIGTELTEEDICRYHWEW